MPKPRRLVFGDEIDSDNPHDNHREEEQLPKARRFAEDNYARSHRARRSHARPNGVGQPDRKRADCKIEQQKARYNLNHKHRSGQKL